MNVWKREGESPHRLSPRLLYLYFFIFHSIPFSMKDAGVCPHGACVIAGLPSSASFWQRSPTGPASGQGAAS